MASFTKPVFGAANEMLLIYVMSNNELERLKYNFGLAPATA